MRQWLMAAGLYLVMLAVFYGFIAVDERQRRREDRPKPSWHRLRRRLRAPERQRPRSGR